MKIENKVLLSITESDLINGHFYNDQITEIACGCFYEMETLISVDCPNVIIIGNDCFFYNNSLTALNFPLLNQCGDNCFLDNNSLTTLDLPLLNKCGYWCFRSNNLLTILNLPLLKRCGNDCFSYNKSLTALNFPLLTQCDNWCFSYNKSLTALNFPLLTQCDNWCFRSNKSLTTLDLPLLNKCCDYCFSGNNSLITLDLPLLTQCGNWCFLDNKSLTTLDLPLLTQCGNYCFRGNKSLTILNIGDKKLKVENVDGDCFVIENVKSKDDIIIYSGYNLIRFPLLSNDKCFVAKKDNFTAHGVDIHKAVEDLLYKISVDKLKSEPIYPDTIVTTNHFKAITGACDLGISDWKLQNNIIVDELKASELLILLEKTDAYGLDKFKQLYQNN